MRSPTPALALAGALCLWGAPASAVGGFTGLGDLPGGAFRSTALDVSADGTVVVGESDSGQGTEAFRWTAATGPVPLGDLPGGSFASSAAAASADGSVIAGSSDSGFGSEAFRWTAATGLVGLNPEPLDPDRLTLVGTGIAGDGDEVVGAMFSISSSCFLGDAFSWTPVGGVVGACSLGSFLNEIELRRVSTDGSTVVGSWFQEGDAGYTVIRNGAPVVHSDPLGTGPLPGRGLGVSADGAAVVGTSDFLGAFRWHEQEGAAEPLGGLPGGTDPAVARDVSGDGLVVVGTADGGGGCQPLVEGGASAGCRAFVWDAVAGMRALDDVLTTDHGVDLTGWTLSEATAVSDDGLVIAGFGTNPDGDTEAWVATLPPRCGNGTDDDGDGLVDAADPGCTDAADPSERGTAPCDDGVDRDGDGWRDFLPGAGGDPGCRDPAWREDPACQNGLDDDGDGFVDFDGGASVGASQITAPDPQCSAAWDNREAPKPPRCGLGAELALLGLGYALARRRRAAS